MKPKEARRQKNKFSFLSPNWLKGLLTLGVGIACFWLALVPIHTIETRLTDYSGGKLEQADGTAYIWTQPNLRLIYRDLPRFAPAFLRLNLLLDRPPGSPPARVEISEIRGNATLPLTTLEYSPDKSGYREYQIKIPAITGDSSDELILELKVNGFRVAGDNRELGVRLQSATIVVSKSGLILAVFTQPLFPALVILLVGLAWWGILVNFGPLELALIVAPIGFLAGAMANYLLYSAWWQLIDALLLVGTAAIWGSGEREDGRRKTEDGRQRIYPQRGRGRDLPPKGARPRFTIKTSVLSPQSSVLPLYAAIAALCGFFVLAPGLAGDIFYFREVLAPTMQYGPFGTYSYAPRLVYPPGSVFQLYLYGLITQPFNILYNQTPLKLLMGSALLFLIPMVWLTGARSGVQREHLARTVLLFGFCLSLLFVPAVWVQADGWLLLLMAAALLLVIWGKPLGSVGIQAFAVIFKAQSWLLLPLYALTFQWRFGWLKALLYGGLCLGLVAISGGAGFAYDYKVFRIFWEQPVVSGESDWGGIRTFNLLHLLGYDRLKVPQPLLSISYLSVGLVYIVVLLVCWRRNAAIRRETTPGSIARLARSGMEWFLAAAVIMSFIVFFWVKIHERYLYFGLGFIVLAALYRRDLYRPALLFNAIFCLNLLYAYIPERRDPVPNNFFFWRHFLHADLTQNVLSGMGIAVCLWVGWLYLRPAPALDLTQADALPPKTESNQPSPEGIKVG